MESKTIKISEENYRWLLELTALLERKRGRRVSFDESLNELKKNKVGKNNIMDLAGAWKDISDKEWGNIRASLDERWKKWKIKSQ